MNWNDKILEITLLLDGTDKEFSKATPEMWEVFKSIKLLPTLEGELILAGETKKLEFILEINSDGKIIFYCMDKNKIKNKSSSCLAVYFNEKNYELELQNHKA